MPASEALDAYRAARRRQNARIARYPLWWAYWKARHLTWRQRAEARAAVRGARSTAAFYLGALSLLREREQ